MSATYVTAFLVPRHGPTKHDVTAYWPQFEILAASGLPIALFLDDCLREQGAMWCQRFPNLRVLEYVTLADTPIYRLAMARPLELPAHRSSGDTLEYMIICNSKLEWLQRAAMRDPFATSHFAWIDFGIAHILARPGQTLAALHDFDPVVPLLSPGCYRRSPYSPAALWSQVCWNFCGGFLVCDAANARYLNDELLNCVAVEYPRFAWEVNFWALLEQKYGVQFSWYQAEFDDSLLAPPRQFRNDTPEISTVATAATAATPRAPS